MRLRAGTEAMGASLLPACNQVYLPKCAGPELAPRRAQCCRYPSFSPLPGSLVTNRYWVSLTKGF